MMSNRSFARVLTALLMVSAAATPMTSALARSHPLSHPPIHVATPSAGSPITPYFFPYGGRYRYNSPGPVYSRLDYWVANASCRLWRYNYLYWVC